MVQSNPSGLVAAAQSLDSSIGSAHDSKRMETPWCDSVCNRQLVLQPQVDHGLGLEAKCLLGLCNQSAPFYWPLPIRVHLPCLASSHVDGGIRTTRDLRTIWSLSCVSAFSASISIPEAKDTRIDSAVFIECVPTKNTGFSTDSSLTHGHQPTIQLSFRIVWNL